MNFHPSEHVGGEEQEDNVSVHSVPPVPQILLRVFELCMVLCHERKSRRSITPRLPPESSDILLAKIWNPNGNFHGRG